MIVIKNSLNIHKVWHQGEIWPNGHFGNTAAEKKGKKAKENGGFCPEDGIIKLTSLCVNLIYIFVNLPTACVWLFDIWHLFENLTSFYIDPWLIT